MKAKRWNLFVLLLTFGVLGLVALVQIIIDPFWHYHKGLKGLEYPLTDERYVNDGLQRNCDYEILITGTSMSMNFNAGTVETLWGMRAIKTTYRGASYHELASSIRTALEHNPGIKVVICSLDTSKSMEEADTNTYDGYPDYLYDDNVFNDVNYLLNKEILTRSIAVINYTRSGKKTPDMDQIYRYDNSLPAGRNAVLGGYTRSAIADNYVPFTETEAGKIHENITKNYVLLARQYPNVEFDFFLPPYSYCDWDSMVRNNQMEFGIEMLKCIAETLLVEDNINVYAFYERQDITTNLGYYVDTIHYTGEVCDIISESIFYGRNKLSKENANDYMEEIKELYQNLDYSDLDE